MIRALTSPITLLLVAMSLQWVALAEAGAFTLLVPYVALLVVAVLAPLSLQRLDAGFRFLRQNAAWILPLTVYLLIILPVLQSSPAATFTPRQLFYLLCSVGLAAFVATSRNLGSIFRVAAVLGLIVLIGFIEFLARGLGLSWADAIGRFFVSGDYKFVVYSFFRPIFISLDPAADAWVSASTKNDVAGCVLVLALLFRSGSAKPESDIRGMLFMAGAVGLLVLMNDRSVLIAAAASLLVATVLGAVMRPVQNAPLLFAKLILLLIGLVIAVALAFPESSVFGTLSQRFSFADSSTEARLEQFDQALAMIQRHPFAGSGYFEVDGYPIHNAFLAAWAYAGVAAFVLVVCFYVALLMRWLTFLLRTARRSETWVLPLAPEWLAALAVMPLFRFWLSGEGGILKYAEWIAITIFFGCLLANDLRRRAVARVIAHHRWKLAERMGAGIPAPATRS